MPSYDDWFKPATQLDLNRVAAQLTDEILGVRIIADEGPTDAEWAAVQRRVKALESAYEPVTVVNYSEYQELVERLNRIEKVVKDPDSPFGPTHDLEQRLYRLEKFHGWVD